MVRSKGEGHRSGRELFHLVEKIRADKKYFPVSYDEIERELNAEAYVDYFGDYECDDEGGPVGMRLRLNIAAPVEHKNAWSIGLKLHDTRIDGIDYHEWLPLPNGKRGPGGWHRHEWESKVKRAERRVRLEGFDKRMSSLRMFLIRAFKELRIEVNPHDDANQLLRFD